MLQICDICGKQFSTVYNKNRHKNTHLKSVIFKCTSCEETFNHVDNLNEHMQTHLASNLLNSKRKLPLPNSQNKRNKVNRESALNVFSSSTFIPSDEVSKDFLEFFREIKPVVIQKLTDEMSEKSAIKWYIVVKTRLIRNTQDGETESITPFFRSKCLIDLIFHTIEDHVEEAFNKILNSFDEFCQNGSGWTLDKILHMEVCVAKYNPLAASSYIQLPKKLQNKKAIINVKNNDNKCFIWSLLPHKYNITDNPHRVSHYLPYEHEILLGDVQCPVSMDKIGKIEQLNNLRINVFGFEKQVFPIYISAKNIPECINLLLISNGRQQHYCLIKNLDSLLYDLTKHKARCYYCCRCLRRFYEQRIFHDHLTYCTEHSPQKIIMPSEKNKIMSFNHEHFQHPVPFVIYADFEALVRPIDTCQPEENSSFIQNIALHDACGYAYIIIDENGKSIKPPSVYRGSDAVVHFLKAILEEKEMLAEKLIEIKTINMTPEDELNFLEAKKCHVCKKDLGADRVRDHSHLSGNFRGAAHRLCNIKYKTPKKIPIIFHNLKRYDAHFIMQSVGALDDHEIKVIANNMENYISFSLTKKYKGVPISLQFIDSYQFLPTSLQKLVEDLPEDKFEILKENVDNDNYKLLLRKGVYPYEYMSSFNKFEETELPEKTKFFSTLTNEGISDEDYAHAQQVWTAFGLHTLGDYHDLYVKSDVLQLADVYQNFRKLCMSHYTLDCAHFLTSPGLAWDSCLKKSQQSLDLLTDVNMHLFIERGIRGGISQISKRHSKANNKDMELLDNKDMELSDNKKTKFSYNKNKESKYILYLDANNLYGWAMSQPLPYGNFQWIKPSQNLLEYILSLKENSSEGFILEVDLDYPSHLHELHNEYPLAPEKIAVKEEDLSDYTKSQLKGSRFISTTKFIPNLNKKIELYCLPQKFATVQVTWSRNNKST